MQNKKNKNHNTLSYNDEKIDKEHEPTFLNGFDAQW